MSGMEILKNNEKAAIVIKQYWLAKMLETMSKDIVTEQVKLEIEKIGVTNEYIAKVLDASPRAFFDILDNHKIYIEIIPNMKSVHPSFGWRVNDGVQAVDFNSRYEAESDAVKYAIELLNSKL